jgi:hypothetical protein
MSLAAMIDPAFAAEQQGEGGRCFLPPCSTLPACQSRAARTLIPRNPQMAQAARTRSGGGWRSSSGPASATASTAATARSWRCPSWCWAPAATWPRRRPTPLCLRCSRRGGRRAAVCCAGVCCAGLRQAAAAPTVRWGPAPCPLTVEPEGPPQAPPLAFPNSRPPPPSPPPHAPPPPAPPCLAASCPSGCRSSATRAQRSATASCASSRCGRTSGASRRWWRASWPAAPTCRARWGLLGGGQRRPLAPGPWHLAWQGSREAGAPGQAWNAGGRGGGVGGAPCWAAAGSLGEPGRRRHAQRIVQRADDCTCPPAAGPPHRPASPRLQRAASRDRRARCRPGAQYRQAAPGYAALAGQLQAFEGGVPAQLPLGRLFYLALPPFLYPEVGGGRVVEGYS